MKYTRESKENWI